MALTSRGQPGMRLISSGRSTSLGHGPRRKTKVFPDLQAPLHRRAALVRPSTQPPQILSRHLGAAAGAALGGETWADRGPVPAGLQRSDQLRLQLVQVCGYGVGGLDFTPLSGSSRQKNQPSQKCDFFRELFCSRWKYSGRWYPIA
jgi:hypothetical protein